MIFSENKSNVNEDVCILLRFANHKWNYLCDCGEAKNLTIADCLNTNAIFISHTHIDHFINFDKIIRHQIGVNRTVTICGPENIARNVQSKLRGYIWNLISSKSVKYEVREIKNNNKIEIYELVPPEWNLVKITESSGENIFENEVFSVQYAILDHKTPVIAYLFKEHDKVKIEEFSYSPGKWINQLKKAYLENNINEEIIIEDVKYLSKDLFNLLYKVEGYSVGVVMDHIASEENHEKICKLFNKADELYIECYYLDEDKQLALENYHSTAKESGQVAKIAKVKKVNPIHFSRRYREQVETLITECISEFEN